ncbi:MAG: DUF5615 family PIN-like protein [Nostoc sp. C3-bin3]|nr:DUF5615 family PIN-like protein [Nostoc sp. C3-bin3]
MVRFYADEQFPFPVVQLLRALGHNVLTVQEAGDLNPQNCLKSFNGMHKY